MSKSKYIPVVLIWFYITMFFSTDLQIYARNYNTFIIFADTFLLVLSFLFYFSEGKNWNFISKKSLLTVISLNVLTEMSFLVNMPNYYNYYSIIILLYFITILIDTYNPLKKTKNFLQLHKILT